MQEKIINRQVQLRGINQEERTAEFVISSETIDRHGTVFKMDGWDLETYNRNPIVCYNHRAGDGNPDAIIGTSEVFRDGDQLIGKVRFEDEGDNEVADKVWRKINKNVLKMASVGARVHEYRWGNAKDGEDSGTIYFTRQELLEWSVVSVGSNPDAFKRSVDIVDEIRNELKVEETMDLETESLLRKAKVKNVAY